MRSEDGPPLLLGEHMRRVSQLQILPSVFVLHDGWMHDGFRFDNLRVIHDLGSQSFPRLTK